MSQAGAVPAAFVAILWRLLQVRGWVILLQISTESVELEELREMKADVERREKAQAAVLERQAKRLDELETLYKVCYSSHVAVVQFLDNACCWAQGTDLSIELAREDDLGLV